MDSADLSKPNQDELTTSIKSEIEKIGDRVIASLKEQPITPEAREVDLFWSNSTVFTDLGGISGEVIKMGNGNDQNWARRSFRRILSNGSGEEIGEWVKTGFFRNDPALNNYETEASFFEEERILRPEKRKETIKVGFDKNRRVNYIQREVSNHDPEARNFSEIETQTLDYSYDEDGQVQKIVLTNFGPEDPHTRQRTMGDRKTVFEDRSSIEKQQQKRWEEAKIVAPAVSPTPPARENQGGFLKRLFRR